MSHIIQRNQTQHNGKSPDGSIASEKDNNKNINNSNINNGESLQVISHLQAKLLELENEKEELVEEADGNNKRYTHLLKETSDLRDELGEKEKEVVELKAILKKREEAHPVDEVSFFSFLFFLLFYLPSSSFNSSFIVENF